MKAIIIAGGELDGRQLTGHLHKTSCQWLAAVDGAAENLHRLGILPDALIGDFDTAPEYLIAEFERHGVEIVRYSAVKDATDTEIAVEMAIKRGAGEIELFGAAGRRLDHFLGNLMLLEFCRRRGCQMVIYDKYNRIRLVEKEFMLDRSEQFGKYVSFIPYTDTAEGVTLNGFRYPLHQFCLTKENTIGVSNEISGEKGSVRLSKGLLLCIESRDAVDENGQEVEQCG